MQENKRHRILVVDDEPQITRVLRSALVSHGYEVETAQDGIAALEKMAAWRPDLLITDLAMPRMDGIALCAEVRARSDIPILVLSVRDQEASKVSALDTGADDYVTKPFGIQEILARVRAQLRRRIDSSEPGAIALNVGDFHIDRAKRKVTVGGKEVHLTPKEFDLLLYLVHHPERVLTHRTLLAAIWGPHAIEQTESLRVLISQLRKKVEPGEQPKYIINEPWVGYRFQPGNSN